MSLIQFDDRDTSLPIIPSLYNKLLTSLMIFNTKNLPKNNLATRYSN